MLPRRHCPIWTVAGQDAVTVNPWVTIGSLAPSASETAQTPGEFLVTRSSAVNVPTVVYDTVGCRERTGNAASAASGVATTAAYCTSFTGVARGRYGPWTTPIRPNP
jgi:hypothetical protein